MFNGFEERAALLVFFHRSDASKKYSRGIFVFRRSDIFFSTLSVTLFYKNTYDNLSDLFGAYRRWIVSLASYRCSDMGGHEGVHIERKLGASNFLAYFYFYKNTRSVERRKPHLVMSKQICRRQQELRSQNMKSHTGVTDVQNWSCMLGKWKLLKKKLRFLYLYQSSDFFSIESDNNWKFTGHQSQDLVQKNSYTQSLIWSQSRFDGKLERC